MTIQRLHVCFLNARFFPIGGTAIRTLNFARAIKNRVGNVSIVTWQPIDSKEYQDKTKTSVLSQDGILFDSMPLGHRFLRENVRFLYLLTLMVEYFIFAKRAIETKKADIIHCANDTVWIGILLGLFTKKPLIADFHATPFLPGIEGLPAGTRRLQIFFSKIALRILDKSIDRYLTPTEELKAYLISWGLQSKKVASIPNAVYLSDKKAKKTRNSIRAELGIKEGTIAIAFHGMLSEPYNIDALRNLSSISRIIYSQSHLKIKFVIIGYYVRTPPVDDDSFIYTGYVRDLQEYLGATDFALVPIFRAEGIRSRFLDYFKAALPVITTSAGISGMGFVRDSGGVIVKNDVKGLADSAIKLANSPEELREISRKSANLVAWFSPEKIGESLTSLYNQAVQKKD